MALVRSLLRRPHKSSHYTHTQQTSLQQLAQGKLTKAQIKNKSDFKLKYMRRAWGAHWVIDQKILGFSIRLNVSVIVTEAPFGNQQVNVHSVYISHPDSFASIHIKAFAHRGWFLLDIWTELCTTLLFFLYKEHWSGRRFKSHASLQAFTNAYSMNTHVLIHSGLQI